MNGNVPPVIPPIVPPKQEWKQKFPAILSGILSFFQCILTLAIIGCEVGSILIDIVTATIYVGFWASLFFMIAWISLASTCMSFFVYSFLLNCSFFFLSLLLSWSWLCYIYSDHSMHILSFCSLCF